MSNCPKWLNDCVIYSLYPQSFYDSNGDGIGDLQGIAEKLPYIKELGCNAIWMNPIFDSDFLDAGYDVKDFYKIAPRYGTEEDLICLCEKAHKMGLKVMLDLVAGHTSITGSHDIKRWTVGRDDEDVKVAYTFIMTMPGVPINYYGDEIGMQYLNITTKEGGRDRTGSRTPMQWAPGKNLGFSESDSPYLPVDPSRDAPTVQAQQADADSILNYVKKLITLRRAHTALWADGEYRTIKSGYPLVFERKSQDETIRVIINASAQKKVYEDAELVEVLFSHNAQIIDGNIYLGSRSCVIYTVS